MNRISSLVLATYGTIMITDLVVLRKIPKYPHNRFAIFSAKYLLLPTLTYILGSNYFGKDHTNTLTQVTQKY